MHNTVPCCTHLSAHLILFPVLSYNYRHNVVTLPLYLRPTHPGPVRDTLLRFSPVTTPPLCHLMPLLSILVFSLCSVMYIPCYFVLPLVVQLHSTLYILLLLVNCCHTCSLPKICRGIVSTFKIIHHDGCTKEKYMGVYNYWFQGFSQSSLRFCHFDLQSSLHPSDFKNPLTASKISFSM